MCAVCQVRGAVAGITAIPDVTAVVCLALSHFIPVSATGREGAVVPTSQVTGLRSRARARVWWFLGWVTLERLLALSEPQFSPLLLTCRPG